ncbi:MAG: DUF4013 domain-containing protein [Chloroflexi bacterium]|nr:DUF4013 domain-containing protein [Chloroflexota bacterium]
MEYGKAFTFLTEDTEWVTKLAIAALLVFASGIIPILPLLLVMGYTLELTRNVARGEALPLPRWDDMETKLKHGAIALVIGFVYMLPVAVMAACAGGFAFATAIGAGASAASSPKGDPGAATGFVALLPVIFICLGCVAAAYGVIAGLLSNAATLIYLNTGELSSAFRVREVWALVRQHLGDFIMVWLATLVANLAVVLIGIITCGLGFLVGAPWLMFMQAHLLGQICRKLFPPSADALAPVA